MEGNVMLWFIIVYALVLIMYFITETSGKLYLRAPNKIILASMFLRLCFHSIIIIIHFLAITSLFSRPFLAWMGDVLFAYRFKSRR
jgi:hypothetical protein